MTKNQALWLVHDYLHGLCDYMAVRMYVAPEINNLIFDRVFQLQFHLGSELLEPRDENNH